MDIADDFFLGGKLLQRAGQLDDLVAVGAAHGLVEKEHKRLLDLPKRMGARVAEVIGVNNAHNMLELVHPCLRCERRFVPARKQKSQKG